MGLGLFSKLRVMSVVFSTWGKIEKLLKSEKEKNGMKLSVNAIVQALMLIMQGLNQASGLLPEKGKFYAMVAMSAIQGIVAVMAHFVNPDGTTAKVAYIPPSR